MGKAQKVHSTSFNQIMTISIPPFLTLLINSWLAQLKEDAIALAGGFKVHDVYKRGLFEAYAGLGCILSEELVAN
jgi:hypothetical protein